MGPRRVVAVLAVAVAMAPPLGAQPRTADSAVQQTYTATRDSWSMVDSTAPNTSFHNVAQDAEIGTGNGGSNRRRAFFNMSLQGLTGQHIISATLNLRETWSGSCDPRSFEVYRTAWMTPSWTWSYQDNPANTVWNNRYGGFDPLLATVNVAKGNSASCPAGPVPVDVTRAVRESVGYNWTSVSLGLRASSETDSAAHKRFDNNPTITIVYGTAPPTTPLSALRVSDNGRFLVKADGSPFFWLGDTAWNLLTRLNRQETLSYLQTRANQRYTVIQTVAIPPFDGSTTPNAQGDLPFVSNNPTAPATTPGANPANAVEYDFWDHIDYAVAEAANRGMYTALFPVWGTPVVNGLVNASNAQAYGEFLGRRYADDQVIWVLGGDRPANGYETVWRNLARGIAIGTSGSEDYSRMLMTYHPWGNASSSQWFHNDAWLDVNMQQNGHCPDVDVWNRVAADYARTPIKPVLDGEPLYDNHPLCYDNPPPGHSDEYDVRKFAWWEVFAGAFGHTYGHNSVWQFYAPGRTPLIEPRSYWYDAVNDPAGPQLQYLRALIESRPFLSRIPDQSVLVSNPGSGTNHVQATRGSDGAYLFVYSPAGAGFTVNLDKLSGSTATGNWYNPQTGVVTGAGAVSSTGTLAYNPPSSGRDNDWVLVLDDADRGFPPPGSSPTPPPGTTLCGASESAPVANGQFVVQNNIWGAATAQCVNANAAGFAVTQAEHNKPLTEGPAAYPSIYAGCHWGACSSGNGLPIQINALGNARSTWSTTVPTSGAFGLAYDIWFDPAPNKAGVNAGELMVWLNQTTGVRPFGTKIGNVTVGGINYDVWYGDASWNVVSYQRTAPTNSVTDLDIRALTLDAVQRGYLQGSWYLNSVQAGFEIWQGGVGLTTNSFSFTANAV